MLGLRLLLIKIVLVTARSAFSAALASTDQNATRHGVVSLWPPLWLILIAPTSRAALPRHRRLRNTLTPSTAHTHPPPH
jgi:hypothetical protein